MQLKAPDGSVAETYSFDDERMHPPTDEHNWQESVANYWFDPETRIGGVIRIGHEPYLDGGNMTLWTLIHTPDGAYCESKSYPKQGDEVDVDGMRVADRGSYRFVDGKTQWGVATEHASCVLTLTSLHPPLGLKPISEGEVAQNIAAHHFEIANAVRGAVTFDGKETKVNGYAHRDHSWGARHWEHFRVHRWVNGVFGPDLCFCAVTFQHAGGAGGQFGYVVRDGVVHHSTKVDIVTFVESDGFSHRGGITTIQLDSGEELVFHSKPFCPAFVGEKRGAFNFESVCQVRSGDRVGVGAFEISENAHGGRERVENPVGAWPHDGLHRELQHPSHYA